MFENTKRIWDRSKIVSAIEGVVREVSKGNAVTAQQWYYDYLIHTRFYSKKYSMLLSEVIDEAKAGLSTSKVVAFEEIVAKLARSGEIFDEVQSLFDSRYT